MGAATFGELLGTASGHLQAAAQVPDAGLQREPVAAAIQQARRVVGALSRYLDDVIADEHVELITTRDAGAQAHAAVHAREALAMAGSSLRAAGRSLGLEILGANPLAADLAEAVICLRAGRDLLRTHAVTNSDGIRSPASRWTAVLTTPAFTAALLDQIARQSRQVAAWASALSDATAGQVGIPYQVRGSLASAHHWLLLAAAAADASQRRSPLTPAGELLLHAIPANAVPDPQPLAGAEPTAVLCEGIAASAMRLRAAVRWPAERAAWSPALTAESWRWTATATAVAADLSVVLLRSLAERTGQAGGPPATARQLLADAAAAAEEACGSWRLVAAAWKEMTTETRGLTAPGVPDTGDLIVRLGRLAFADPLWAPARSRRAPVRDPADLAPGAGEARAVLAAVHDAADALAVTSAVDLRAVALAVRAGRLHAPARSLPERDDKAVRRFGSALATDTTALRGAYASAAADSAALVDALDAAAVALDAPTKVLAVARAAVRASRDGAGTGVGQAQSPGRLLLAAAAADASQRRSPLTPAGELLLHAIPANAVPDPQPLAGAEPPAVLCEGIAASAMRLRAAVRWPAEQAAWSPALTAESWRWTATATAVAADLSVVLLRSLAERAGQAGGPPATARQLLADAAAAAEEACGSWRLVAAAWKEMTTETRGLTAPGVPDTGDLIVRLGRLAFADPLWAPARSRRAPVRDPADLAPGAGEARAVLAAVHDAADALAVTSAVDLRAVALAVRAGRLHAPARSLPERDDKAVRRFGSALATDTTALREAYASAAADSAALVDALDAAAVALDAPTKVLAVARAAVRASRDGAGTGVGPADSLGRLLLAAAAADASQRRSPLTPAGELLLHAIPANAVPDPQPLAGAEPTAVLCEGIAVSAMRLRAAVRWPAEQAAWSPALTAESWRWTATATAVAADLSVVLLRSLAERAGQAGGPPATARQLLADAAAAAEEACGSWRLVAAAWKEMTTETRGLTAPGVPDTGDLIVRLGRLAFADPLWAPARSRRAPVRDPADLAPGAGEARAVLAAVHDAADALAVTSAVDLRAVALAVRAGRLHAPARSLPERDDKAVRRFGSALATDTTALREAYASAAADSAALVDALDAAAVALDAPTKVLAVARAAVRASRDGAGTGVGQADSLGRLLLAGDEGVLPARISVEEQVRGLGVVDPMLLLRARAIDRAWQQVVAQAQAVAGQPGAPGEVEACRRRGPTEGTALGVAAQSFPHGSSAAAASGRGIKPGAQRRGTTAGSGPRALPPQASAR